MARLVSLLVLFTLYIVNALDVSWLPSDPDGPLPLSANYRKVRIIFGYNSRQI